MRTRKGRILPRQRKFAQAYVSTGDHIYAAEKAGYQTPATSAHKNLRNPDVLEAIKRESMARLSNELLPLALDNLAETLRSKDAPYTAKMKASSIIIENTIGRKAPSTAEKDPAEMSLAELQTERRRLEEMLEEAKRPVLELTAESDDDLFG